MVWKEREASDVTLRATTQSPLKRDKKQLKGCWRTQKGYWGAGVTHLDGIFRRAETESKDTTSVTEERGLLAVYAPL